MAHYAFLNDQNIVVDVIVGKDEGEDGIDWEDYYGKVRGLTCKRTSYNTESGKHRNGGVPFRKNFAAIGGTYDPVRDAFIPPCEFVGWKLNEQTLQWEPPHHPPSPSAYNFWNNDKQDWDQWPQAVFESV